MCAHRQPGLDCEVVTSSQWITVSSAVKTTSKGAFLSPPTDVRMLIYSILGILVNMALAPVRMVQQGISAGNAIFQEGEDMIKYDLIWPQISCAAAATGLLSQNLWPQLAGAAGIPEGRGSVRVFLCQVLKAHLMQEVSYTSDNLISQKGLISCLIYAVAVNNSATCFASCCSTTFYITDTAKPRHKRGWS